LIQSQAFNFAFLCRYSSLNPADPAACAVVPCQWERIIGSYSEVTRAKCKKLFNRLFFHHYGA
ncbi:hypothetical protein, partial [Klebsiella sp. KG9]|uniref:hypothetical protein n=1 Tax=Klebsiella sp. KG9 TaxID=2044270 RepID=UPI001BB1DA20